MEEARKSAYPGRMVRLGAPPHNRFAAANNGGFLDDWRLERVGK